jgi:SAM-dependent methyltransferase
VTDVNPPSQYATDLNLAARQHLWTVSRRDPPFDLYPWVLDVAGLGNGSTADVLDLGCGNGRYEQLLAERGHGGARVALDLSAGMLATVPAALRVRADAQRLPFPDGSFDVVLAPHMLYHVPDVAQAAREARRVLRPGGTFVAATNGESNLAGLTAIVEEAVGGDWRLATPAHSHFSLESGAAQLAPVFTTVERVDTPKSDVVVTDVEAFAGYVASIADAYQDQVACPWSEVVERARALCAQQVDDHGELRLSSAVGVFICG